MEAERFDALVRSSRLVFVRRGSLAVISVLGLGHLLGSTTAGKKNKKKKKKKQPPFPLPAGLVCVGDTKLCGERCIPSEHCCASGECAGGKQCIDGRCRDALECAGDTKPCGAKCIPTDHCCESSDCGAGKLCVGGRCFVGQGSCPAGDNICTDTTARCDPPSGVCVCFRTTAGATRCGDDATWPNAPCGSCASDADCEERVPHLPGIFCAEGGAQCGSCNTTELSFCRLPCPA